MKSKVLVGVLVMALMAALVGGATMAWFTDKDVAEDVTFAAGTLTIAADQVTPVETTEFDIVNPGDMYCVGWEIENTGTKRAELRFKGLKGWNINLDDLTDPAHIAICPNFQDDWKIIPTEAGGFEVYYTKGPIDPNGTVKLVLVVAFDGPDMDNNFQGQAYTLSGQFEAVQTTNGAPEAIWGEDWKTSGSFDLDGYFADFAAEDWPECCGQEIPQEEKKVDDFNFMVAGHKDSTRNGSTTTTWWFFINSAKYADGTLVNGFKNVTFYLTNYPEMKYTAMLEFINGSVENCDPAPYIEWLQELLKGNYTQYDVSENASEIQFTINHSQPWFYNDGNARAVIDDVERAHNLPIPLQ